MSGLDTALTTFVISKLRNLVRLAKSVILSSLSKISASESILFFSAWLKKRLERKNRSLYSLGTWLKQSSLNSTLTPYSLNALFVPTDDNPVVSF